MLKQLPIKKEYLLVAAALILLLLSYRLAFRRTAEAWQINTALNKQLAQSTDVSYQPQYMERKNANLEKIISLYKADTINFRSNIINSISLVAEKENVKLSEVPTQDPLYHTSRFTIQKLNFEGGYFSLIKVLDRLQTTKGIGMVRSADFKKNSTQYGGEKNKLILSIYFEMGFK